MYITYKNMQWRIRSIWHSAHKHALWLCPKHLSEAVVKQEPSSGTSLIIQCRRSVSTSHDKWGSSGFYERACGCGRVGANLDWGSKKDFWWNEVSAKRWANILPGTLNEDRGSTKLQHQQHFFKRNQGS